jgi:two-component SAPR family response regulator
MTILILDSSILVIQRLHEMLSEINNISSIYRAQTYKAAIDILNVKTISLLVIDSGIGNRVIDLIKNVKESKLAPSVIILSNPYDDYILRECRLHGADFIFDKYYEFEKITGVINALTEVNDTGRGKFSESLK